MVPKSDHLIDPLCGMKLDHEQARFTYTYIGRLYGFCSRECYDMFVRAPEYYVTLLAHELPGNYGHRCPIQRGE